MTEKTFKGILYSIFGLAFVLAVAQIFSLPEVEVVDKLNLWLSTFALDFVSVLFNGFLIAFILVQINDFRISLDHSKEQTQIETVQAEYSKSAILIVEYKDEHIFIHNFGNAVAFNIKVSLFSKYSDNRDQHSLSHEIPYIKINDNAIIKVDDIYATNVIMSIDYHIEYNDNSTPKLKTVEGKLDSIKTRNNPRL